jgi:hypothetical protein
MKYHGLRDLNRTKQSICVLFPNVHVGPLLKLEGLILKVNVQITAMSPFCLRIQITYHNCLDQNQNKMEGN